jgi:hypothetical protein
LLFPQGLAFSIYLLSVCLFLHYGEGYFFFPMNFPCTAVLEGSVFIIKLEVILEGIFAFIGKFRFLVSVEGKTLGGKEENAFTCQYQLLGKDENAFTKPFTVESIYFPLQ